MSRCAKCSEPEDGTFKNLKSWADLSDRREQGLECEAEDKQRQALVRGIESNDEPTTVNSATMKEEELSQKEDEEI